MYILANVWFTKLIRQFFFSIDKIVFGFISEIYDLLILIARTSVLSQAEILDMADRIYKLLAVFMIFKVTLSLITYVVNPDDFSDKSKGVSKLGLNIIISLGLLILTPYIFNYAFQLQTIVLEDNSLAAIIFGDKVGNGFLNSAGDQMAFTVMSPFYSPNLSIDNLQNCVNLMEVNNGEVNVNEECFGLDDKYNQKDSGNEKTLAHVFSKADGADLTDLVNYTVGLENSNLGLMFRQDGATATFTPSGKDEVFIMDYKFIFSTVVGVVVCLLLLTFCMDVGVRSIKLAFLQLVAPIPIISYVDPKSGKDGLFKKWYQMCFKTYLSLFIRLLTIYFAVYIIGMVADFKLVDVIDGSYVTNKLVAVFIIIGALMFAQQLPKILEGLGIKLDGDGKFTLNPLKKFEDQAFLGKNITGMARGALMGTAGALSGAGAFRGLSGAWRGMTSGKGWKEAGKAEAEMNKKMRQAKLDGSTLGGRFGARFATATGLETASEKYDNLIRKKDDEIKALDAYMEPSKTSKKEKEQYTKAVTEMQDRAIAKIKAGEAGGLSTSYFDAQNAVKDLEEKLKIAIQNGKDTTQIRKDLAQAQVNAETIIKTLRDKYIDANMNRNFDEIGGSEDKVLSGLTETLKSVQSDLGKRHPSMEIGTAKDLDKALGVVKSEIREINDANIEFENKKTTIEASKKEIYEQQRKAKADETAVK